MGTKSIELAYTCKSSQQLCLSAPSVGPNFVKKTPGEFLSVPRASRNMRTNINLGSNRNLLRQPCLSLHLFPSGHELPLTWKITCTRPCCGNSEWRMAFDWTNSINFLMSEESFPTMRNFMSELTKPDAIRFSHARQLLQIFVLKLNLPVKDSWLRFSRWIKI